MNAVAEVRRLGRAGGIAGEEGTGGFGAGHERARLLRNAVVVPLQTVPNPGRGV